VVLVAVFGGFWFFVGAAGLVLIVGAWRLRRLPGWVRVTLIAAGLVLLVLPVLAHIDIATGTTRTTLIE
jgi:hypothetical protein